MTRWPDLPALPDWTEHADCAGGDTDHDFFPHPTDYAGIARGKRICADCPVRVDCLGWALHLERSRERRYGIYGGLTPDERHRLATKGAWA